MLVQRIIDASAADPPHPYRLAVHSDEGGVLALLPGSVALVNGQVVLQFGSTDEVLTLGDPALSALALATLAGWLAERGGTAGPDRWDRLELPKGPWWERLAEALREEGCCSHGHGGGSQFLPPPRPATGIALPEGLRSDLRTGFFLAGM